MNAAIYIYYTPDWQPLADIVLPKVKEYCTKHNYTFVAFCLAADSAPLNKMKGLSAIMHDAHDFIWVLDLDTLITNPEIRFTDYVNYYHDIFICNDVNGINAGSWVIRNSE